jgi:hypothetical protein
VKSGIIGANVTGISRPCLRLVDEIGFDPWMAADWTSRGATSRPCPVSFTADLDADGAGAAL